MKPLKIVIISKNCYPKLGPRAHRTTELAKELVNRGHMVIVYSLLGNYNYESFTRETGIILKNLGESKYGVDDNTGYINENIFYKLLRKSLGKYLEFPLIELAPMVQKALNQEENIDYLITIAHPHTIHWGAAQYIHQHREKISFWVADCGDPFMKDPFNFHPFYFKKKEKKWGKLCDYITVPIAEAKEAYYSEFKNKIKVIPQGFDFKDVKLASYSQNKVPTFAYSGVVYKGRRDPTQFLEYLSNLKKDFKFIVYTKSKHIFLPYKKKLGDKLEIKSYIPHKALLFELSKMDFLINLKNITPLQQPSKLIDYALTKRPVLEITSEFIEKEKFIQFIEANYSNKLDLPDLYDYAIKNVADKFLKLKAN